MNYAFKTRQFVGRVSAYNKTIELMKIHAKLSCHIVINKPVDCKVCVPYHPKGICAPMQPIGSCIICGKQEVVQK